MGTGHRLVRSITTNWLSLALNVGISFFLAPFVVRHLGSTYYGIWAITMQFTGYLHLLDFGVRESVIRYTSKYVARAQERQLNHVLNTAMVLYVPITIICIALTALCAYGVPRWFEISDEYVTEARIATTLVGLTIAQTFVFNVFTGVLQGLNRFDIANAIGIVMTLVRTALIVTFLSLGYGLVAMAAIQFTLAMAAGIAGMIIALRLLRAKGVHLRFALPRGKRFFALTRRVFGYGFYVLVNNIAQKVNFSSDAIIIGLYLPVASVTPYAIAGSLVDYLRMLTMSTAQVFSPISSHLHALRRNDELATMFVRGCKLAVVATLPIAITYVVLGDVFVGLWMGPEYMEAAGQILFVLGMLQVLSAPHYVMSSVLYGMSQHRTIALLRLGEAVIKAILSVVLVQSMGILGVAIGTAIPHVILVLAILPVSVCFKLKLGVGRYFAGVYSRPLLAALPFVAGALVVRYYLEPGNLLVFFAELAVLCAVYAAATYAIVLTPEERAMAKRLLLRQSTPPQA